MTSRWPRWTPSNSPTATRRGRGSASGSDVTFIARKPTTGFRAPSRGSATAIGPSVSTSRTGPCPTCGPRPSPAASTATPCDAWRAAPASRCTTGRKLSASVRDSIGGRRDRRPRRRTGRSRAAQLLAVGVAQVGDQAADVGARRALDREAARGSVTVAPELLEAVHGDGALGDLDRPPRARALS